MRSAHFIKDKVDMIKIASGDNNYYDLIKEVLNFKKPTIFSTGFLNHDELKNFVKFIKNNSKNFKKIISHCVSSYPVSIKNINLENKLFKEIKVKNIGFSDHTIGIAAPLASFFYGVKIIEKHFTLDNNYSKFRDHKLSLNPADMRRFVTIISDFAKLSKNLK